MSQWQAPYRQVYKEERVNIAVAARNLLYLLFSRIPDKALALLIFSGFLFTVAIYSTGPVGIKETFSRIDASHLPYFSKTTYSLGSKRLRHEEARITSGTDLPTNAAAPTPAGLAYLRKIRVFATSYDKNCKGCNSITATGLPAGYGVAAVDPKVIPLGSKLYVPGYGVAVAGDTGGNIKGNKIDLGFDSVAAGWWSARFVDVYILE